MTQASWRPLNILFVCVGNSCRSQMAEAWANHLGRGRVQAHSAGSHPLGVITEKTYTVMGEKGISLDGQCSKGLRDIDVTEMDVVVGMGCEVACPVPAGFKGRVVEWEIPDPYGGSMETFRDVRDLVEQQVRGLFADLRASKAANPTNATPGHK
jgi:protein-tyrosine-phosphatase